MLLIIFNTLICFVVSNTKKIIYENLRLLRTFLLPTSYIGGGGYTVRFWVFSTGNVSAKTEIGGSSIEKLSSPTQKLSSPIEKLSSPTQKGNSPIEKLCSPTKKGSSPIEKGNSSNEKGK
jgi:hypothetical protein